MKEKSHQYIFNCDQKPHIAFGLFELDIHKICFNFKFFQLLDKTESLFALKSIRFF